MRAFATVVIASILGVAAAAATPAHGQRNVIIFVADGLRYDSVTPESAPTLAKIRRVGVDFANSHSAYPTLTTVNAAVIATGHYPGDTGNYGNNLFINRPLKCAANAPVAFVEDNCVLRELKAQWPNDYLGQTTIMAAARKAGFDTVLVGKRGPLAIQDMSALESRNNDVGGPHGIFLDEEAGRSLDSPGVGTVMIDAIRAATGSDKPAATAFPNLTQQAWQASVVSQVLLPRLKQSGKPFIMLFWSRDPDITQHNATDSDNRLSPGINSSNSRMAIYNADMSLRTILEAVQRLGLSNNTDVIVVADHGFSTISKAIPGADESELPYGFLARDVATWLNAKAFDPARQNKQIDFSHGDRPRFGNALIGVTADAPQAWVTTNGSDYIYIPEGPDRQTIARRIFSRLVEAPYVGALFVNDDLLNNGHRGDFAGSLPMSQINLIGSSRIPNPAIVVGFRSFVVPGCKLGKLLCAAEVSDTNLHTGQGNHGSFSRADTRNFMAAVGPDFKAGFVDRVPVGNSDVAVTAAHLLGVTLTGPGVLKGRVIVEALIGNKAPGVIRRMEKSGKAANGFQTVLDVQEVGTTRYFDAAGEPGRVIGLAHVKAP
ncbi:MAG: alkaline phosphatase family protein [Alphaproteobacteria bacterium]|nr:alkaline phosphatase family protein [Alphaproteobacteria bacterium]MDE2492936.1 alkaline phosphatase family protein [Alphaproteobacteria bacterium]